MQPLAPSPSCPPWVLAKEPILQGCAVPVTVPAPGMVLAAGDPVWNCSVTAGAPSSRQSHQSQTKACSGCFNEWVSHRSSGALQGTTGVKLTPAPQGTRGAVRDMGAGIHPAGHGKQNLFHTDTDALKKNTHKKKTKKYPWSGSATGFSINGWGGGYSKLCDPGC